MKFDLDKKSNSGEWFTYFNIKTDDDGENKRYIFSQDEEEDKFCIRKPDQDLFDKIERECQTKRTDQVFNKKTHKMERQTYYLDQTPEQKQKQLELMADWTFVDWTATDKNGEKIPLTIENKVKMMKLKNAEVDMDAFVVECWKMKSEAEAREKEERAKN